MSRVDYSISDNTKLFVRYNCSAKPSCSRWASGGATTDQVPYPTPVQGKNRSDSVTRFADARLQPDA